MEKQTVFCIQLVVNPTNYKIKAQAAPTCFPTIYSHVSGEVHMPV